MSRELDVAKEIVTSFWYVKHKEVKAELFRVKQAKPEELVKDYEALIPILKKALKEIREGEE